MYNNITAAPQHPGLNSKPVVSKIVKRRNRMHKLVVLRSKASSDDPL